MTRYELLTIMPLAATHLKADEFLAPLGAAMDEFGIDTPVRQAAFLAQIGHESGQLQYTRELWGPTDAQRGYEGRADLGNVVDGDGFRFRGRGLIQITGRANYAACGVALGLDLLAHPDLLEGPVNACRSAAWFWHLHGLNALADAGDFEHLTKRINGGLNGYPDRVGLWGRAKNVLAVA